MPKSMTGFGQAEKVVGGYEVRIEAKSVNHRYLEVVFRLPRQWTMLEESFKKRIQQYLLRGRVEVYMNIERSAELPLQAEINWPLADSCMAASRQLQESYQLNTPLTVRDLFLIPDVVRFREAEADFDDWEQAMGEVLEEAVRQLLQMREREGADLTADMKERLNALREFTANLNVEAPRVVEDYRNRLASRLKDWLTDAQIDEQRIAMEAALLADKADISEELTRLSSHLDHAALILDGQEAVGRKLDFLLQELNREVNTVGSKANSAAISGIVVQMKAELEKIREQAQNLE
ncbi:YicC/YloC family endoribonuclease [Paenibacillus senegalensis]|uniref:YicC/YloC family endoribonuclease n=1 Tax=Paenibacillus senegalensis TaxID=1465766 RepID=UPI000288F8C3|nr:YicC/YloC family endoribonuclease [Paenibacillus senegalensis]